MKPYQIYLLPAVVFHGAVAVKPGEGQQSWDKCEVMLKDRNIAGEGYFAVDKTTNGKPGCF
jgi:hypothetical protein